MLDTQWPRSGRALAAHRRSARVTDASPSRYRAPSSPSSCPPCPCAPVLLVHPLEVSRRSTRRPLAPHGRRGRVLVVVCVTGTSAPQLFGCPETSRGIPSSPHLSLHLP